MISQTACIVIFVFSACFSHSYMYFPKSLLETTIVPVIKNKCGSLTDCNFYRPIAIATITSKLLESLYCFSVKSNFLLLIINLDLRQATVLSFALYSLLEFIDFYKKRNTTVLVTFLDASKADEIHQQRS